MQGATVESAIVVARPGDLTAGWSYTALSRARGSTRLLIHPDAHDRDRSEFAPPGQPDRPTHPQLLDRIRQRMSERDSEDLALEQLPTPSEHAPAGGPRDPDLATARSLQHEPHQDHAAHRAEWATTTLGEPPDNARQLEAWEKAIHATTTYRTRYNITTPNDPLGPRPEQRGQQQRDYQRAQRAIQRAQHRLHLVPPHAHEHDLGIGL